MDTAQLMNPRRCGQPGHGAFRFHGAAWITTSQSEVAW